MRSRDVGLLKARSGLGHEGGLSDIGVPALNRRTTFNPVRRSSVNFSFYALMMVPQGGSMAPLLFQVAAIFAIFYFFLIRPQVKERKRHEEMLSSVRKGDDIVTTGGIIGKVVHAEETQLIVRTAESTRVTVDRTRIATVLDHKGNPQEE